MRNLFGRVVATAIVVYIVSLLTDFIDVRSSTALIVFALVYVGVGLILRPLMLALGFPVSIITLGLFVVVINAWILMIADLLVKGILLNGFLSAFIVSAAVMFIEGFFVEKEPKFKAV